MDDILGALENEWMRREAERLDNLTRALLKSSEAVKTIYVDAEGFKAIEEQLGYVPSNLVVNNFLPKGQAIILNDNF